MRIAVDARPLSAPLTGIGRYTEALLQQMVASGHQWFIYSDRPLQVPLPESPRICVRYGSAAGGTPGSLRWAQWGFARWAIQDVVDIFWSPRHHLPLLLPARIASVVTIHDLVWCQFPETMKPKNLLLERVFGDQILQIGSWGPADLFLRQARTQYSALLSEDSLPGMEALVSPLRLPVLTDSVDAVILPPAAAAGT